MVFISDIVITIPLEILFFYFMYRSLKITSKSLYLQIMNLSFLIVDLLVILTVIISDLGLGTQEQGWLLGFITGLSYLILPWFFYWFIANFQYFTKKPNDLIASRFQLFSLVATIIIGLIPIVFPDIITLSKTATYSYWNWDYGWQLFMLEFLFWIIFAVLCINKRFDLNSANFDDNTTKFLSRVFISAILVFSTPVFFVVSSDFILLSLVLYVISYLIIYDGLKYLKAGQPASLG